VILKLYEVNTAVGCDRFVWLRVGSIAPLLGHDFEHKCSMRGGELLDQLSY